MAKKKQTDDEVFNEANRHWHKLMNCLIRAYHKHGMSITITFASNKSVSGWELALPEEEYTIREVEEGERSSPNASLKFEKIYCTD